MKNKSKNAKIKRRKDFKYHGVTIKTKRGKQRKIYHPAYVFLEKGKIYIYVSLTHSEQVGKYLMIKLKRNPNPKDDKESYIIADIKEDTKDRFRKTEKGWKLDEEDDELIRSLYKNKKDDSADRG